MIQKFPIFIGINSAKKSSLLAGRQAGLTLVCIPTSLIFHPKAGEVISWPDELKVPDSCCVLCNASKGPEGAPLERLLFSRHNSSLPPTSFASKKRRWETHVMHLRVYHLVTWFPEIKSSLKITSTQRLPKDICQRLFFDLINQSRINNFAGEKAALLEYPSNTLLKSSIKVDRVRRTHFAGFWARYVKAKNNVLVKPA